MTHPESTAPLAPREVAEALRAALAALRAECAGLPAAVLRWHPAPGEWCVLEVIGHLIEAEERGFAGRVRTLLAEPDPEFRSWDPEAVARARQDCGRDPAGILAEWTRLREASAGLVEALRPGDLARAGRHPRWAVCRSGISWPSGSTTTATTSGRSWRTSRHTCGRTWGTPGASPGPNRDRAPRPRSPTVRIVIPEGAEFVQKPEHLDPLRRLGELVVSPGHPRDRADFIERVKDADVVVLDYTMMDDEVLARCPRLKFVAFLGIGYTSCIDIEAATRRGIVVSNTPDYGATSVAEHVLGDDPRADAPHRDRLRVPEGGPLGARPVPGHGAARQDARSRGPGPDRPGDRAPRAPASG